ncbi:MAG: thioredoxin domain-containing protein [Promethearchaeia archaeon]|jgi:hypothetical protein
MAKPWEELHTKIATDEEYAEAINYKGLTCMEVHAGWCGSTTAVVPTMKKLHWDMVEERSAAVQFIVANSDAITELEQYRDRSKPLFLFYVAGEKKSEIDGVNTISLTSYITENAPSQADIK